MSNLANLQTKVVDLINQNHLEINLTVDEIQQLFLIEFNYQQRQKRISQQFSLYCPVPEVYNDKVVGAIALAVVGVLAAPLLGVGALTAALVGAAIGWRLFGGSNQRNRQQEAEQTRITSTPGFDSAPQPPTVGSPVPLLFTNTTTNPNGGLRVTGNVVNSKVTTFQNQQKLFCLLALGLGEIQVLDNSLLLVDNQSLENFHSGTITANYVTGTETQSRFADYPYYSQVISPNSNNLLGISFRGKIKDGTLSGNAFEVEENDYDSFVPTERYRLIGTPFRVTNKVASGGVFKIITDTALGSSGDSKLYATYRCKYKTNQKCSRIDLNFAFDISARDKESNELTTYAVVFDLYLDGVFVSRFYEANKKEGTIRRAITLDNLTYKKHTIETYTHTHIYDAISPLRIDDSGVLRVINTGVLNGSNQILLEVESNPNNHHSISQINEFLNNDNKVNLSSDRGANGRLTTINEVVKPTDLGHSYMSNYRSIVLNNIEAKAEDNLTGSPAYSNLVKKALIYRNHIAAGVAATNSQVNTLITVGVDLSEVLLGYVCRNITRQTESVITQISGGTITTQFSLNWQAGEDFLVYFDDSINYFPDVFVFTRLNKKAGIKGLSVTEKFIDYPSICEARRFCKINNYFFDDIVDEVTEWNDWVSRESVGSLLYPFKAAGNYGLKIEENVSVKGIFNAARILPGSFTQSRPNNNTINAVQLNYKANDDFDEDRAYFKTDKSVLVITSDVQNGREEIQKDILTFSSITNESQARNVAAKYLKSRILQDKVITFKTGIAGFNQREGDLILVQHPLIELEVEISGFAIAVQALSAGVQEITLNKQLDDNLSTTPGYTASIYHLETGTIQLSKSFTVLPNGNLLISSLSEAIMTARENYNADTVIINKNANEKIYRISSIEPENYEVKITAINWSSDIHNSSDLFFIT